MLDEFEYHIARWTSDDNIPILTEDDDTPTYLYSAGPIEQPETMVFKFGPPIPLKPKMADYLTTPKSVVSRKIYEVLEPMQIYGIQLLPAIIRGKNDQIFEDYWAIHIFNLIKCVDPNRSICEIGNVQLSEVQKLVLNKEVLNAIPLKERLIFRLIEDTSYKLFHVSIVNAIMNVKPTGIRFINLEIWNDYDFYED